MCLPLGAADLNWNNSDTNFNADTSWTEGTVPGSSDRAIFGGTAANQPNLTANTTIDRLLFSSGGYTLGSTGGFSLNVTNTSTGSRSNSGIHVTATSGVVMIDTLLDYNGGGARQIAVEGGATLVLSGGVSHSGTLRMRNAAAGTIRFATPNTGLTGAVNLDGGIFQIGHDNAFGTASINTFVANNTIEAFGGSRTIANDFSIERFVTVIGSNNFGFSGDVTLRSSQTSGIDSNSTGVTSLSGNVFLNNTTAVNTANFGGSGQLSISGAIADFDGTTTARNNINLNGTGGQVITFSGNNVYTGNTTIGAGVNFTLADSGSLLFKLDDGVTNTVGGSGTASFNGALVFDIAGVTDFDQSWNLISVGTLTESFDLADVRFKDGASFVQDGQVWTSGFWSFDQTTGALTAIPEPSSWASLFGVIALGLVILRRRPAHA